MENNNLNDILGIESSRSQNNNEEKFNSSAGVLVVISYLIAIAGIIVPIISFIKIMGNDFTSSHPELLIAPLYIGLLLIAIGGLGVILSALMFNTTKAEEASEWKEQTLNVIGVILIIVAIVGFFMVIAKTNKTFFSTIDSAGIIGGLIFLILNVQIGLLCIVSASAHKKYKKNSNVVSETISIPSKFVYCQHCGNKIDLSENPEFCDKCGKKIEIP